MKKHLAGALALAFVLVAFGCTHYHFLDSMAWHRLIDDGKGMENFSVSGSPSNWREDGGAIVADKNTGKGASVLVSKKSFKDFEMWVEFWSADDTNSGIYFRAPDPKNVSTASGAFEAQIWDKNPNPAYASGSLVNVSTVDPIHKTGGRWNTFEIYAKGSLVTVKLNGVVTASVPNAKSHAGHVGVQSNGGPIKVRKLLVKEI